MQCHTESNWDATGRRQSRFHTSSWVILATQSVTEPGLISTKLAHCGGQVVSDVVVYCFFGPQDRQAAQTRDKRQSSTHGITCMLPSSRARALNSRGLAITEWFRELQIMNIPPFKRLLFVP